MRWDEADFGQKLEGDLSDQIGQVATYTNTIAGGESDALIQDTAYSASWDGETTHAASKNAIYDKIESVNVLRENIYYVSTDAELDAAISDIESNNYNGRIIITADLTDVQVTINDASASYIIEGTSPDITLDANGDVAVFTVTTCGSLVIRNLTLDLTDHASVGTPGIDINGGSNITIENVIINGDDTNSIGITIDSAVKAEIINNRITDTADGIYANSTELLIKGNIIDSVADDGIHVGASGDRCLLASNIIRSPGGDGIQLDAGATDNQLSDNLITNVGGSRINDSGTSTIYGARYS